MIFAAHQPSYLPYMGFFHKMARADVFVWLDDVQFEKRDFQNRNRIRTSQGPAWLTVPVVTKGRFHQAIGDVEVDETKPWRSDHWKSLEHAYGKAPSFKRHAPFFEQVYARPWPRLAPLCVETALYLARALGIERPCRNSSEFKLQTASTRRLVDLGKALGAGTYLSGSGAKAYLEEEPFREAGLGLAYDEFHPVPYPQRFEGFVPYLSAVDFLFNVGEEQAKGYSRTASMEAR